MDYAAIKTEVTTQPQYAAAYAARDVNAIQAIYNAVTEIGKVDIQSLDRYLKSNNVVSTDALPAYWTIKSVAAGTAQLQAALAQVVLDLFSSRLETLDFSLSVTTSILDKCVAAGVLSAQNKTDLLALAAKPRNVSIQDLAFALFNPDGTVK